MVDKTFRGRTVHTDGWKQAKRGAVRPPPKNLALIGPFALIRCCTK